MLRGDDENTNLQVLLFDPAGDQTHARNALDVNIAQQDLRDH